MNESIGSLNIQGVSMEISFQCWHVGKVSLGRGNLSQLKKRLEKWLDGEDKCDF